MPRKNDPAYKTENSVFATRLREIMKERGKNQTTLADKITSQYVTIQRQTISLYMNGQSKPDTERLTAIAKVLDVSADWLLGLSDERAVNGDLAQASRYTGLSADSVKVLHKLAAHAGPLRAVMFVLDVILREQQVSDFNTWAWRAAISKYCHISSCMDTEELGNVRRDADRALFEVAKGDANTKIVDIPIFDYETVCTSTAVNEMRRCVEAALELYKAEFCEVFAAACKNDERK